MLEHLLPLSIVIRRRRKSKFRVQKIFREESDPQGEGLPTRQDRGLQMAWPLSWGGCLGGRCQTPRGKSKTRYTHRVHELQTSSEAFGTYASLCIMLQRGRIGKSPVVSIHGRLLFPLKTRLPLDEFAKSCCNGKDAGWRDSRGGTGAAGTRRQASHANLVVAAGPGHARGPGGDLWRAAKGRDIAVRPATTSCDGRSSRRCMACNAPKARRYFFLHPAGPSFPKKP